MLGSCLCGSACTPCTNTTKRRCTTRGHFSSHCSTEVHRPVERSYLYHGKATTQQHAQRHKERHMRPVACMSVLLLLVFRCLRHVLEPQKPKPRVRLIPHLSSPLLEPPVKVGSQGVLAIQLTAIGTHALQAVGPQDWPMALYTIFCRTFGLLSHTANVQLPRHGPTSSLFSQAHSARSGRSQASLLPTIPI